MYCVGLAFPIHLLVAVSGVVVAVDVDVVVDGPVVPVAEIINKIPTAHVVCSTISPFTLTLIPPFDTLLPLLPCAPFHSLLFPSLPYRSPSLQSFPQYLAWNFRK